jgi:hypothetical protein
VEGTSPPGTSGRSPPAGGCPVRRPPRRGSPPATNRIQDQRREPSDDESPSPSSIRSSWKHVASLANSRPRVAGDRVHRRSQRSPIIYRIAASGCFQEEDDASLAMDHGPGAGGRMGGCGGGGTPAEDLCSGSGCLDLLPPLDPGSDPGAPDTGRDLGAFDVPVEDPGSEPGDLLPDGEDCGGGFGCPCDVNRDCLSGLCMPTVEGKFCTVTCVENCPSNWKCEYVSPPGLDPIYACVPPRTSLCRPCSKDSDCAVGRGRCPAACPTDPRGGSA